MGRWAGGGTGSGDKASETRRGGGEGEGLTPCCRDEPTHERDMVLSSKIPTSLLGWDTRGAVRLNHLLPVSSGLVPCSRHESTKQHSMPG